jgi:hypothetical protein
MFFGFNSIYHRNVFIPFSHFPKRPPIATQSHGRGLPGNVDMIRGSALTPRRESVSTLPAPAYRQEGGESSRLAREET